MHWLAAHRSCLTTACERQPWLSLLQCRAQRLAVLNPAPKAQGVPIGGKHLNWQEKQVASAASTGYTRITGYIWDFVVNA